LECPRVDDLTEACTLEAREKARRELTSNPLAASLLLCERLQDTDAGEPEEPPTLEGMAFRKQRAA